MTLMRRPAWAVIGTIAFGAMLFSGCGSAGEPAMTTTEELLIGGCSKHKECEDGNPCTQNLCLIGACAPALPVLGCCFNGSCVGSGGTGGSGTGGGGAASGGTGGAALNCSQDMDCADGDAC